jgi:hypothetical protein
MSNGPAARPGEGGRLAARLDYAFADARAHYPGKGLLKTHKKRGQQYELKSIAGLPALPDTELDNFAQGLVDGMTGNAAYPAPPVTMANLQTAKNDFTAKIAAAQAGGPTDTAAKNNSRQTLLGTLRQLASYVQINCNNDMATLLGSGFQAMGSVLICGGRDGVSTGSGSDRVAADSKNWVCQDVTRSLPLPVLTSSANVGVGMTITNHPLHGSGQALLTHPALALGNDAKS